MNAPYQQFQPSVSLVAPQENQQPAPQPQQQVTAPLENETEKSRKAAGAFRTISEVAEDLSVQQHVLRFWETKFSQVRPLKRGGGRRYYRPEDVEILKTIHNLLYTQGYTIKGVQKLFREQGKNKVVAKVPEARNNNVPQQAAQKGLSLNESQRATLQAVLAELRELRELAGKIE